MSESIAKPKRQWQRRKNARPSEILAAALQLAVEKSPANLRMADIAERAGVTKGTLYLYFRNKEEVLRRVTELLGSAVTTPQILAAE